MIRFVFAIFLTALMAVSMPANAQGGDFGDIFEDIFKTSPPSQGGSGPYGGPFGNQASTYIDNIPVQVTFDARPDLLPAEATLIVTAIAPPAPNVRRASPLIIGETRLLISRLAPPLQLVIAVPSDMARTLDYAQIEARIVDSAGNTAFRLRDSAQYNGSGVPFLELIPAGAFSQNPPSNTPVPAPNGNTGINGSGTAPNQPDINGYPPVGTYPAEPSSPVYTPPAIAVITGTVALPSAAIMARGSTLVLEVSESSLAGGYGSDIVKTERIDIDQKRAPFKFDLNIPMGADGRLESSQLNAYIEDWAGRKTFVYPRPVAITQNSSQTGFDPVYIKLDPLLTGARAADPQQGDYTPPQGVMTDISGEARFNAYKGLPQGATLNVFLRDADTPAILLGQTDVALDGRSGNIGFNFQVESLTITNRNRPAVLTAQITDKSGRLLFYTQSSPSLSKGFNPLSLIHSDRY